LSTEAARRTACQAATQAQGWYAALLLHARPEWYYSPRRGDGDILTGHWLVFFVAGGEDTVCGDSYPDPERGSCIPMADAKEWTPPAALRCAQDSGCSL